MNKLTRILKDESAQGATEYILLVAVVVGIVMLFKDKLKGILGQGTDKINEEMKNF